MIYPSATDYNLQLVIVSIAISMLASYTALNLAERVTATKGRSQVGWLISGSIAMGVGIWAMHFIGMLAFRLPFAVHYDFLTVLISILPAIIASGLALFLVSRPMLGWLQLLGGSLLMGVGIASMHYIGMAAMQTSAVIHYDPQIVALSVLIAIAVSFAGLFLVFQLREKTTPRQIWKKLLAAIIMGSAIPTMHYVGMASACFLPISAMGLGSDLQATENVLPLALAVIIGTLIILGLALLTTFFDRQLTAQIITAQAFQESQEYLKTILQGIQVGVLVLEGGTQVQLFNRAVLDLLHLSTESELQELWNSAMSTTPDAPPPNPLENSLLAAIQPIVQKVVTQQPVQNAVVYIQAPADQNATALLVNAIPLNQPTSSLTQVVCTFNEVTELKQIENRLKASEEKFKDLAKQEELLNHLSTQIRRSLDLPTILQTTVCEVRNFFETDRVLIYQFDENWQEQDGVENWSLTLAKPSEDYAAKEKIEGDQTGKIRAISTIPDVGLDDHPLQELYPLQVQANLTVPIVVHEQSWGFLIVHQCSYPRIWQEKEENLLHRLAIQLGIAIQQSNFYSQAEQSALQAQAKNQQLLESEAQLKRQAQALQQTLQDRQSLQMQLIQSEKMSSLGQLVAGIAHEINNPVNFIYGNVAHAQVYVGQLLNLIQLYEKHYPQPGSEIEAEVENIDLEFLQTDLLKLLTSMQIGTDRIREIVLSLRKFSRMDEAEFKAVDIHSGIDSTLMILQHRLNANANRPEVIVTKNYAPLPLVECYPGQLNQVFMNILSNAIDALNETNIKRSYQEIKKNPNHITISTSRITPNWAQISIADNGSGIPEAIKNRIFDPFFTTKPIGQGTGIGMSISYQIIVEKHKGKLECFSHPGHGSEFVIQIPMQH
jgi:NO-binding membrane sensor protein with MHYT domain/signal transduction histidine kinase